MQILSQTPLPKLIRAKVTPSRSLKIWEIILLALGAPLWLSILLLLAANKIAKAIISLSTISPRCIYTELLIF